MEIIVTGDELNALNKKVGSIHMPKPITNEEHLKSCNTEQLATFLAIVQYDGTDLTLKKNRVEKWMEWLKQPKE